MKIKKFSDRLLIRLPRPWRTAILISALTCATTGPAQAQELAVPDIASKSIQAQTSVESASTPMPSSSSAARTPPQYDVLTRDDVDFFIPVITMEQFFSRQTRLPGYRIQIFKSGKVLYQGMKFVKTLGEVELNITPQQVEKIQAEFSKYKFWQVPPDQYGLPRGQGVLVLQFTLRDGERVKTLRFGNNGLPDMLQHVIDSEVDTTKLRCPFLDEATNLERCEIQHRSVQRRVRSFLSYDLPKLLELYK